MKTYDTIIVGGGPSGATAARCLARLGADVLLLDKTTFPRQKPCGGALSPKAYGQMDFDISDLVKARVRRTRLRGPGRSRLLLQSREVEIWMVCREELDLRLLEQASQSGVLVKQMEPVESVLEEGRIVRTTREEYRTRTLVGADGYGSLVARRIGLGNPRPRYFRSIHLECPVPESCGEEAVLDFAYPGGYAWLFPKGEVYNAGICTKERGWDLRPVLEGFLRKEGVVPAGAPTYHSWPIPLGGHFRPLHHGMAVLVGDAAGLADPLLGEGIAYAMMSARLAARAIERYLKGETHNLSSYSETMGRTLRRDLCGLSVGAALLCRFPRLFVAFLGASPALQGVALSILSGQRSPSGIWTEKEVRG